MKRLARSFLYAFKGLKLMFRRQLNFFIQLTIAAATLLLGLVFNIKHSEWLAILSLMALVLCLEIVNTAIERLADALHPGQSTSIGQVKDLMAAAVMLAAAFSVAVGLLIFIPYISF